MNLQDESGDNVEGKLRKTAVNLLKQGVELRSVAQVTGLSIEELQKVRASI